MSGWNDGYVTDVVYTQTSYREMTPLWLSVASLMLGHRPPDVAAPFRYADLGCGHGLTATIVAATCPDAEVWGFDFNPAHIESARRLASLAGLTNVHFEEASFAALADRRVSDPAGFDFVVSHGVMSWISAENRARLVEVIGRWLRPGGLAYLSYNVTTGWAAMQPVRALMRTLLQTRQERTDLAVGGVLDYLDGLKAAGAGFFAANPGLAQRLSELRTHNPRYVAHEFLNADWDSLTFTEVAAAMESVKCSYIGSATLTENIDSVSVPAGVLSLVNQAGDVRLKEALRDFGMAKGFRRDIYRRGVLPVPGPAQVRLLDQIELVWSGRVPDDPIKLATPLGEMLGMAEIYRPLMAMLMAGGCSVGAIRRAEAFAGRPVMDVLQAVVLLISDGYAHPALPETVRARSRAGTDRLNTAIGTVNAEGGDIGRLAAAVTGSEVATDPLETLVVRERLSGRSMEIEALTDRVLTALTEAGRFMQRDGKPVRDMAEARPMVRGLVDGLGGARLGLLERLGVVSVV
jgi:SAM-dependent methyltransferase